MNEIIDTEGAEAEETENSLGEDINKAFLQLDKDQKEVNDRLLGVAKKLRQNGSEGATKSELAQVYDALTGDVLSLLRDIIRTSGISFQDVVEVLADMEESGGGDEDDGGEAELDEDAIKIYATLKQNVSVFEQMQAAAEVDEAKTALSQQIDLNLAALAILDEQYGEEIAAAYQAMTEQLALQ